MWYPWWRRNSTAVTRTAPRCARLMPTDSAKHGTSSSGLWQQTVGRARGMAPELLHERVEGEWSFIETLRHLVFATDAWVKHRAGLPRTGELRRTPLPAGHPQRGVGAQAVRRKGPPHARVPVALTPGAASALDEARDAVLFIRDPNRETFSRMVADPGYQQVTHLRSCTGSALGVRSPHECRGHGTGLGRNSRAAILCWVTAARPDRLLTRPARAARPVPAAPGASHEQDTPQGGQACKESPGTTSHQPGKPASAHGRYLSAILTGTLMARRS